MTRLYWPARDTAYNAKRCVFGVMASPSNPDRAPWCYRRAVHGWPHIVRLYDLLYQVSPSPVVALNRAWRLRLASATGVQLALSRWADWPRSWPATQYFHSSRADLLRRLDRTDEARAVYQRALPAGRPEVPGRPAVVRRVCW